MEEVLICHLAVAHDDRAIAEHAQAARMHDVYFKAPHPREILLVQDHHCIFIETSDEETVAAKDWATSEVRKQHPQQRRHDAIGRTG